MSEAFILDGVLPPIGRYAGALAHVRPDDLAALVVRKTTDIVGLDVRLAIAKYLERELGPRFAPPQILRDKVAAGELGRKTGKGFYEW